MRSPDFIKYSYFSRKFYEIILFFGGAVKRFAENGVKIFFSSDPENGKGTPGTVTIERVGAIKLHCIVKCAQKLSEMKRQNLYEKLP